MRNVRFNDDVVKELRRLVRNANLGNEFKAALSKIYQAGYDNGLLEAKRKIQEVLHDNQSASSSDNDDRVGIQSDSGINGGREGADADDSDSSEGSQTFPESIIDFDCP